jgi:hypothetical protein
MLSIWFASLLGPPLYVDHSLSLHLFLLCVCVQTSDLRDSGVTFEDYFNLVRTDCCGFVPWPC